MTTSEKRLTKKGKKYISSSKEVETGKNNQDDVPPEVTVEGILNG
jgi:hypothetical protein